MERSKMVDSMGKYLTQSLFLELGYKDEAIYTLKEEDHEYNGIVLPSIKRLYVELEDPTEYEFATTYFAGWKHWQRICDNKVLSRYIAEWREELEVKLRSQAVRKMKNSADSGNYQAAKWLADRGWDTRKAGRPSREEIAKEVAIQATEANEYSADASRLLSRVK